MRSSLHDVCQQKLRSAKRASRTMYNKLRYGYHYKQSYSTVVYSDRYFRHRLTLDTKTMPLKCFVANDLGAPLLYKKFSKLQKNYLDFFVNPSNTLKEDLLSYTRHYMPIHTAWAIRPYHADAGPLQDFGDPYLFYHIDRRFFHRSIFADLSMLYEKSRRMDVQYKPVYDMLARCREMMDYDEYIYAYAKLGDLNHKQLRPLIYLGHKPIHYRLSDEGSGYRSFSEDEVQSRRKRVKKLELYQPMQGRSEGLRFPVPDFALSDDQLLVRKKGGLYERIKSDTDKIYDSLAKQSPRISAANLADADLHNVDKTYSARKILNTDVKRRSVSFDRLSTGKGFYNNGTKIEKKNEKTVPQNICNFDCNNKIVMEPLLLMQTLSEDRRNRKKEMATKQQKVIVRVILTYSVIVYVLSFVTFYFFSLS